MRGRGRRWAAKVTLGTTARATARTRAAGDRTDSRAARATLGGRVGGRFFGANLHHDFAGLIEIGDVLARAGHPVPLHDRRRLTSRHDRDPPYRSVKPSTHQLSLSWGPPDRKGSTSPAPALWSQGGPGRADLGNFGDPRLPDVCLLPERQRAETRNFHPRAASSGARIGHRSAREADRVGRGRCRFTCRCRVRSCAFSSRRSGLSGGRRSERWQGANHRRQSAER